MLPNEVLDFDHYVHWNPPFGMRGEIPHLVSSLVD